jgi:hypothetical protein
MIKVLGIVRYKGNSSQLKITGANHQNLIDQKLFATLNNAFLHTRAMKLLLRH